MELKLLELAQRVVDVVAAQDHGAATRALGIAQLLIDQKNQEAFEMRYASVDEVEHALIPDRAKISR
jgi:hypothetical protein